MTLSEPSMLLGVNESQVSESSLSAMLLSQNNKHSQLDIYLSKEDILEKFLFSAVTGSGQ